MSKYKDPAFLFYPADFMVGTRLFSFEQKGKYIELLCLQHQQGHLSKEDIETICGGHDPKLFGKFVQDEQGMYYNDRLEEEMGKRAKFVESRQSNGALGGRPKKPKQNLSVISSLTYEEPRENLGENENINENIDINDIENIIKYLNSKVGSTFDAHAPHVVSCVTSCMRRGHTYEEMIKVIDYKASEWLNSNMAKYLRPSTLFGDKFERYIEELSCAERTSPKWSEFDPEEALRRSIARAYREEVQGNGT